MLTDFYEITMANGYFQSGKVDEIASELCPTAEATPSWPE